VRGKKRRILVRPDGPKKKNALRGFFGLAFLRGEKREKGKVGAVFGKTLPGKSMRNGGGGQNLSKLPSKLDNRAAEWEKGLVKICNVLGGGGQYLTHIMGKRQRLPPNSEQKRGGKKRLHPDQNASRRRRARSQPVRKRKFSEKRDDQTAKEGGE